MEEGKAPGLSWKRVEDTLSVAPPFPRALQGSGGNTSGRRKSLSCAVVEGLRPSRFVTEVTNGTASQTPRPQTSLPRFEHGVLCCLRPGRGCAGGAAPDHTRCTPPPAVPPKEERNGEGWQSPDGRG